MRTKPIEIALDSCPLLSMLCFVCLASFCRSMHSAISLSQSPLCFEHVEVRDGLFTTCFP